MSSLVAIGGRTVWSRRRRRKDQLATREMESAELQAMLREVRDQARVTRVNATTLRYMSLVQQKARETAILAAELLDTPLSAVNLLFADHQLTVAGVGLDEGSRPLASSYCKHVVSRKESIGIASTLDEPLVCHDLATTVDGLRSYLGVPLITHDGYVIGALCVADFVARYWTASNIDALTTLAARLMDAEHESASGDTSVPEALRLGTSGERPPDPRSLARRSSGGS